MVSTPLLNWASNTELARAELLLDGVRLLFSLGLVGVWRSAMERQYPDRPDIPRAAAVLMIGGFASWWSLMSHVPPINWRDFLFALVGFPVFLAAVCLITGQEKQFHGPDHSAESCRCFSLASYYYFPAVMSVHFLADPIHLTVGPIWCMVFRIIAFRLWWCFLVLIDAATSEPARGRRLETAIELWRTSPTIGMILHPATLLLTFAGLIL